MSRLILLFAIAFSCSVANAGQLRSLFYTNCYSDPCSANFTDTIKYNVVGSNGNRLKTVNGVSSENNYNPLKDFTSNIHYVNCNYVVAEFSFSVDTTFLGDIACWDFGDGSTRCDSHSNGASHNYSTPGTNTVSLTFTRNGSTKTITKSNLITIRNAPQVEFDLNNIDKDSLFAPVPVDFLNQTIKGDGDSLTYAWDFGDGYASTEANPSHTFNSAKTYFVSLTVKDNFGCSIINRKEIVVKDSAQRNEINYIVGSCTDNGVPACGWDKHFIIEHDSLKIFGFISGNCCTQKTATVINSNDTIVIRTFEVGQQCTCGCAYCFAINVPNIHKDSVNVSFNGQLFTAKKTLSSIRFNPFINDIRIYPNPVKSDFTIDYSALNNNNYQIEVFNMMGQMVYQNRKVTTSTFKVDAGNLKSGFYLIRTFADKSTVFMNKIIINNAY